MTSYSEAHIIFYTFIGFLIGVGLFFSRSMDRDVHHYFFAGMDKGGGMIGFSIFLFTLFNAIIIFLPSLTTVTENTLSIIIASAAFVIPLLLGKQMMSFFGNMIKIRSAVLTAFLNLLVLFFLCSVQILVLIQITDYVAIQFFGSTQYSILVVMIVAAGIYTMAGGFNSVLYSNVILGGFVIISLGLIFLNSIFFHHPLYFSFRTMVQFGNEIFRISGITESNLGLTLVGIVLMMFWMLWMQIGDSSQQVPETSQKSFTQKLFFTGAFVFLIITGALILATSTIVSNPNSSASAIDPMNYFLSISFLGGLMGIFAITFQMVGSIVALRLYPFIMSVTGEEEQILVGRLSTVFIVLLSVILVSFAKVSGYKTFIWYTNFVAFFFTPVIAALTATFFVKKGATVGFISGILVGEIYAIIGLIGQQFEVHSSFFQSASAYAFSVEIALFTLIVSIISGKVSEMVVIQKMLLRLKISRTTM